MATALMIFMAGGTSLTTINLPTLFNRFAGFYFTLTGFTGANLGCRWNDGSSFKNRMAHYFILRAKKPFSS